MAMAAAAFLCLLIGSYLPFLYNMLPYQEVTYHPYSGYHLSETLQILALLHVAFIFLKDKLGARPTISLDLDWFYRMGGRCFLWLATKSHPMAGYRLGNCLPGSRLIYTDDHREIFVVV